MDKEKIEELMASIAAERDVFVQEANNRIAFLNGKIEALRELAALETEDSYEPTG